MASSLGWPSHRVPNPPLVSFVRATQPLYVPVKGQLVDHDELSHTISSPRVPGDFTFDHAVVTLYVHDASLVRLPGR